VALLTLESIGPEGEKLALEAGRVTEIYVGWDPDLECATFDADGYEEAELEGVLFDALNGLNPKWREHLRIAE
jgi:hypothetical protein